MMLNRFALRPHLCRAQRGVLHNLILPALVLLGVTVAAMTQIVTTARSGLDVNRSVDEARVQLQNIRSALRWCYVLYPGGNNGTSFNLAYPASTAAGDWVPVKTITCPGRPGLPLMTAAQTTLPNPPQYLKDWEYKNDATGIYLRLPAQANENGLGVLRQIASRIPSTDYTLSGYDLTIVHLRN